MKTEHLLIITKTKAKLEKAIKLLTSDDYYWREDDLLMFADLRDKCNLFDLEFGIAQVPNKQYSDFEQSITYHDFPNCPDAKDGEVVMAYLQCQGYHRSSAHWSNITQDIYERWKREHEPKLIWNVRQIWVAANQETKAVCECGVPEAVHGTSCGWANACYTIDAGTDEEKRWNREWVKAHPQIHLNGESTFTQEGKEEQAKEAYDTLPLEDFAKIRDRFQSGDYDLNDVILRVWGLKQSPSTPKEVSAEQYWEENYASSKFITTPWIIEAMNKYATLKTSSLQQENQRLEGDNYILTQSVAEWKERAGEVEQENDKLRELLKHVRLILPDDKQISKTIDNALNGKS